MKKDVTNAGKNTDDYDVWKRNTNVWKRMSLMQVRILMIIMKKNTDVTNAGKNTDDYNVWKRMSLMQVRILMIIMYEKGCH